MSKSKLYALTTMVVLAGLQVYAAWSGKEIFPLSPWTMYSLSYNSQDLQILRITCAKPPMPKEKFISEFDLYRQEVDYAGALDELKYADLPLPESARRYAESVLAPLKYYLKDECTSFKVYRYEWRQFTGQKRFRPDRRELIYETAP